MVYKPLSHISHRFFIDFPQTSHRFPIDFRQISLANGGYFNQRLHHVWVHHPIGLGPLSPRLQDSTLRALEILKREKPKGKTYQEEAPAVRLSASFFSGGDLVELLNVVKSSLHDSCMQIVFTDVRHSSYLSLYQYILLHIYQYIIIDDYKLINILLFNYIYIYIIIYDIMLQIVIRV